MVSQEVKIVVLGGGAVGKSALVTMFVSDFFVDFYDPTIEDAYRKQVFIDERAFLLDILDTAGQEEYSAMRDQYMQTGNGFLLVYSINSRNSFDEIQDIRRKVFNVQDKDSFDDFIPMVLVGNKCDLEFERQVTTKEAQELAEFYKMSFFETSAKNNINVEECFFRLVRIVNSQKPEKVNKLRRKRKCILM